MKKNPQIWMFFFTLTFDYKDNIFFSNSMSQFQILEKETKLFLSLCSWIFKNQFIKCCMNETIRSQFPPSLSSYFLVFFSSRRKLKCQGNLKNPHTFQNIRFCNVLADLNTFTWLTTTSYHQVCRTQRLPWNEMILIWYGTFSLFHYNQLYTLKISS